MSHAATNWAIRQKGLKPATKIVLWYLADCHNGHTGQCNPKQETLAEECEMSRSALNAHLDKLEEMGLIQRHTSIDPRTKRQLPTHYTLALDTPAKADPVSEKTTRPVSGSETRPVSDFGGEPCPDFGESRVRNPDAIKKNPGKEPGRGTEEARAVREILCSVLPPDVADDWIEHRKAKRSKMTVRAAELIAAKLVQMPNPVAAVHTAIEKGWTGIFPVPVSAPQQIVKGRTNAFTEGWLAAIDDARMADGAGDDSAIPLLPARH